VGVQLALISVVLKFMVAVAMRFLDCLLVAGHQKRFLTRWIKEVGGERLHNTTASLKVGVLCGGGNGEGQATKFEREGGQVAARGVARALWCAMLTCFWGFSLSAEFSIVKIYETAGH